MSIILASLLLIVAIFCIPVGGGYILSMLAALSFEWAVIIFTIVYYGLMIIMMELTFRDAMDMDKD